jgi:glutamyl-tRNA synthetase
MDKTMPIEIKGPVRVRFAPSPTGFLHIGGVRTALFNWVFAQHYGGQFLLRIEDTDEKRFVPGAADDLMASLRWVGLLWDEGPDIGGPFGPYVQSQRHEAGIYKPYVEQLLEQGLAYMSFTTEAELEAMKAAALERGVKAFRFRGPERDWPLDQQRDLAAQGRPHTVRLKVPLDGTTTFTDLVRGGDGISVQNADLYDIVLVKSSGMPLYHLAHLVDDHLMQITHVMRSDEWVPSAPYHVLLYQAFGWEMPAFVHLPTIQRQDGRGKLSKRKDDVATNRFWERGYLPEAMFNYLALQGWSYDDRTEIMSREEIVERFSLDRVQPSPARWNPEKLKDMNGIYIRRLPVEDAAERVAPFLAQAGLIANPPSDAEIAYIRELTPLIHERLEELADAPALLDFFFQEIAYDPKLLIPKKMDAEATLAMLRAALERLAALESWAIGQLEEELRALGEELEIKPGPLFGAIRVAVSGRTVAPPLFDMLAALGKPRTLERLQHAIDALAAA